jgi:Polyketide cyclase / dehydrase and lipid transport
MNWKLLVVSILVVLAPLYTAAEVTDSAANGFTSKATFSILAPPDVVYQRLLAIGNWWSSDHTFSGDAHNLSIDPKPMGCWCEKLPNGGSVRHMQVVALMPGKMLVMTGGLGPLRAMAATGAMKITLAPASGGTRLEVTYSVTGYVPAGMNTLAGGVDKVLTEQFARLKNYAEQGDVAPKK